MAAQFKQDFGIDLRKDKQALQRLTEGAEKAKIELSTISESQISLLFIINGEKIPILYRWRDESPAPNPNNSSQNTSSVVKYG